VRTTPQAELSLNLFKSLEKKTRKFLTAFHLTKNRLNDLLAKTINITVDRAG